MERIQTQHCYRLPTDLEWSQAAGLTERAEIPAERENDIQNAGLYSWGNGDWPPLERFGNFADEAASGNEDVPLRQTISGYRDGFARAAPVGQFAPNQQGFFDLDGNVKEWVLDPFKSDGDGRKYGVLRGADWKSYDAPHLELRYRLFARTGARSELHGFRVVLAKEDEKEQEEF